MLKIHQQIIIPLREDTQIFSIPRSLDDQVLSYTISLIFQRLQMDLGGQGLSVNINPGEREKVSACREPQGRWYPRGQSVPRSCRQSAILGLGARSREGGGRGDQQMFSNLHIHSTETCQAHSMDPSSNPCNKEQVLLQIKKKKVGEKVGVQGSQGFCWIHTASEWQGWNLTQTQFFMTPKPKLFFSCSVEDQLKEYTARDQQREYRVSVAFRFQSCQISQKVKGLQHLCQYTSVPAFSQTHNHINKMTSQQQWQQATVEGKEALKSGGWANLTG